MPDPFFRSFAENSADVVCRVSLNNILRYASPSCARVLGWQPEELVGKGPDAVVVEEDLPRVYEAARQTAQISEGPGVPATVRMRHKDGSEVWMEIAASVVPSTDGQTSEVVLVMRDISDRKALEEQLTRLAVTDGLTSLLNRRGFDDLLENTWQKMLRAGSELSLLLLDLDHFKALNDRYGHQVGDDCLRAVAAAIGSCLKRSVDCAARYGGEELAVILPGTSVAGACEVAERIRRAVENLAIPHAGSTTCKYVTISIGIATAVARCGGSMRMPESLLLAADSALYRAKHEGRNRICTQVLLAFKAS